MQVNAEKLQTISDLIGRHWSSNNTEPTRQKENNSALLLVDELFKLIIEKGAKYNDEYLKRVLKGPNDPQDFSTTEKLLQSPIISDVRQKALMKNEIHQHFLDSSYATENYTSPGCLEDEQHIINLRNLIAYKIVNSDFFMRVVLTGWKPDYFQKLQEDPQYLLNICKNNPQDVILLLKSIDVSMENYIMGLRMMLDKAHIYVMPRKNLFMSDLEAYYLNLSELNVPLDKIKSVMPYESSNEKFLSNVVYCPISATHCAIAVPLAETFKQTFPTYFKHLIVPFVESDLPEYIALTNATSIFTPISNLSAFRDQIMRMITLHSFDFMLMSRALNTLASRNINAMMSSLIEQNLIRS